MNTLHELEPIMIVEDNPVDLDLSLRAFKKQKFLNPIIIARDGEEAMSFIDKWEKGETKPILILLDIKLPKVSGLEFLKKLKSNPELKSIPVVILTTSSEARDVKEAYEYGANSYILKPVEFEKFIEVASQIDIYWRLLNKPC